MKNRGSVTCLLIVVLFSSFSSCDKDDAVNPVSEEQENSIYDDDEGNGVALLPGAGTAVDLGLPSGTLWTDLALRLCALC